jgi:hypothetical protein
MTKETGPWNYKGISTGQKLENGKKEEQRDGVAVFYSRFLISLRPLRRGQQHRTWVIPVAAVRFMNFH